MCGSFPLADADSRVGHELVIRNHKVLRCRPLTNACRSVVGRTMARAEIAAERTAVLTLARAQRHAAEVGTYAERDQPVRFTRLRAVGQRLRIAKFRERNRVRCLDLRGREVAD